MLFIIYIPILLLALYSITKSGGFAAYGEMFADEELTEAVLNTFILALSSAAIATVIGTFTAIGIFNLRKKTARTLISGANQITIVNADVVTGVSLSLLFVFLRNIGLPVPRGWFTLITAHVVITTPYVVLSVLPRLRQLNANVYEAALDLGASPLKATIRVILPQLLGAMTAGFALAFTLSLDDFVITKYNNGTVSTISTLIYGTIVKHGIPNSFRALSTLLFILILAILVGVNIASKRRNKPQEVPSK
jgi:spermidine/putrescine transport system permease protein